MSPNNGRHWIRNRPFCRSREARNPCWRLYRRCRQRNAGSLQPTRWLLYDKREKRLDPTVSITGGEEDGERLLGLNLSIPLPVRNNFSHEVTAAYDQYTQAQQLADGVFQRARARLVSAAERYRIAHGAWQDWQQIGQPSLQQQGDQLRRLWEAGELSTTEFLLQTSQVIDSRDSALDLRETLWHAWFEWLAASGKTDQWLGADSLTNTGAAHVIRDGG